MTQLKITDVYADLTKISISVILFLVSSYANSTLKIILLISSLALTGFFVFNISKYYFHKFYTSHKILFLFTFFAIVLVIIFYLLYLKTGPENEFFYALTAGILVYAGTLITVLCKS